MPNYRTNQCCFVFPVMGLFSREPPASLNPSATSKVWRRRPIKRCSLGICGAGIGKASTNVMRWSRGAEHLPKPNQGAQHMPSNEAT